MPESPRVTLPGSHSPRVRAAQDLGPAAADMPVLGITLVFRRSPAQEAELNDLLAAQQNTASPLYHHWLTPETFAKRFGIADEDVAATEKWLLSHGFHMERVARSRDRITFSGTAAQVRSAFGAELHRYRVAGQLHFAPVDDLTLPAELGSITAAILHLSDFRPKPNWTTPNPKPNFTSAATQTHYLGPKDILTMYNLNAFYDRQIYGAGQGLAIVGQSYISTMLPSSISNFQTSLTQYNPVNPVLVPESGVQAISPGDQAESEIDLEYSSGIAQNANIYLVYVGSNQNYSVFDSLAFAITENIAPVVSISYSTCEPLMSPTELDAANGVYEEASAQGQTLVASSGDAGSTSCAPFTSSDGATPAEQQELAVSFPASSPYFTAVGGTQMVPGTFAAGNSSYWALPTNSFDNVSSLLSYVPEVVWNEGSAASGIFAGGGGSSSHFPRPDWQNSFPGIPAGAYRLLPDIALQASAVDPGFLVCSSDPALLSGQGQTSSCTEGLLGSNNKYTTAGGTSFAAPIFAGFVALLNEAENATGQGNINPLLYRLAANPDTYAAAFHDITSGTNACVAGVAGCSAAGESGFAASAGFDQATGLGSLDFNALTAAWPGSSAAGLQATTVLLVPSAYAAMPGDTVSLQIHVSSLFRTTSWSVPTGGVSVAVDGTVVESSLAFTAEDTYNAQASTAYNLVAPSTPGSHLVTITYPGDAAHVAATATYSVMVGNVLASGAIALSAGNLTIVNGSAGSTEVTVTPSGGYNGRLVWSIAVTGTSSTAITGCYSIAPLLVDNISTAKLTLGTGAACKSALPAYRGQFKLLSQHRGVSGDPPGSRSLAPAKAVYVSLLLCGCLAGWRRRWQSSLLLVFLLLPVAGVNLTGCGGGGGGSNTGTSTTTPSSPVASSTNFTVTLTATDSVNGLITGATTFTLTVN